MAKRQGVVDVNVWLGTWPFQYFYEDRASRLEDLLENEGVTTALVCSPEAAFNPDTAEANRRLAKAVGQSERLKPVMTLNPVMANWRDLLARYRDEGVAAVRLMPGYHVYSPTDTCAVELVEELARGGGPLLTVQMRIEDERTHHARCQIPGVDAAALMELAGRFPKLPILAMCAYRHEAVELTTKSKNIHVELSHVESMNTVPALLKSAPVDRLLFGSHAPFLYLRAMVMKVGAKAVPEDARLSISRGNALRLLGIKG